MDKKVYEAHVVQPPPAVRTAGVTIPNPIGAMGHMKIEPPARYSGKGFPGVAQWLEEVESWLALSPCIPTQWVEITGTRLEKGASTWFMAEKARIRNGQRANWANWQEFRRELITTFAPQTDEEQARKSLKTLKQTGSVQNYLQRFRELQFRIPTMSETDIFSAFMDGLKADVRKQIGIHVHTLQEAQYLASKADLYIYENSGGGQKDAKKKDGKGGKIQTVTDSSSAEVLAVEQQKLKEVKKKRKAEQRRLKKLNKAGKETKGKPTRACNWCGKEGHFVKDCPVVKQLKDMAATQDTSSGNA